MISSVAAATINHVLDAHTWARERLRQHAGKTAMFESPPFSVALLVGVDGRVTSGDPSKATVTFTISAGAAARLAARDMKALNEVNMRGDTVFAADIRHVWENAWWDFEEDLTRVFGDIAGHRMAEAGRSVHQWSLNSADSLAKSVTAYWTQERPIVAARHDIEQFNTDVDTLRDDVERIAKRIDRLEPGR
jgi:ubiquinone biosynthesis protein UbiJ